MLKQFKYIGKIVNLDTVCKVFYNVPCNCLDFYFMLKNDDIVKCFSITYESCKELMYGIEDIKSFLLIYEDLWFIIVNTSVGLVDRYFKVQYFSSNLWYMYIDKNFNGVRLELQDNEYIFITA